MASFILAPAPIGPNGERHHSLVSVDGTGIQDPEDLRREIGLNLKDLEPHARIKLHPPGGMCHASLRITDAADIDAAVVVRFRDRRAHFGRAYVQSR